MSKKIELYAQYDFSSVGLMGRIFKEKLENEDGGTTVYFASLDEDNEEVPESWSKLTLRYRKCKRTSMIGAARERLLELLEEALK